MRPSIKLFIAVVAALCIAVLWSARGLDEPGPATALPLDVKEFPIEDGAAGAEASDQRDRPDATLPATVDEVASVPAGQTIAAARPDELPMPSNKAFDVIRERMLNEVRDPVWAATAEGRILEHVASTATELGFVVVQAECRKTICRVDLGFAGDSVIESLQNFSLRATVHSRELREALRDDADLETLAFDSGIVYGTPMSLMYLRRLSPDDTAR